MRLSVVIPTLNEAGHLRGTLASLPRDAELVVSDGGSVDETLAIASEHGAHVVRGPRGRARQMNEGAKIATGNVLLFLHADCILESGAREQIATALSDRAVVGGSFRLRIDSDGRALDLIARTSNARARYLGTSYGDQGLFVRRGIFDAVGGFPDQPFMEDVAMVRALKRRGKLVPLEATITTGARHWERLGPVLTTVVNWATVCLYLAGVPPERLAPTYYRLRNPASRPGTQPQETS